MADSERFWDFPEDGFIDGAEYRAEKALLHDLARFGHSLLEPCLEDPDDAFCPGFCAASDKGGEGIEQNLLINLMDWLLFDHAFDDEGRTIVDLYWQRKKLFIPGLQKMVLPRMRETAMNLFEVRAVYPGRGFDLKSLSDGRELQVVDMMASRQVSRWTILACRPWLLDGVHRLSGSLYSFTPDKRPMLEKQIRNLTTAGKKDPRAWREGFSPLMCLLWIDPLIHPKKIQFRNMDGDRLVFCRAVFHIDDREAVRRALLEQKEIMIHDDGDGGLMWCSLERDAASGQTTMGTFQLREGEMTFEANSRRRFQRGMKVLKETLGDAISLKEEEQTPLKKMLDRQPIP